MAGPAILKLQIIADAGKAISAIGNMSGAAERSQTKMGLLGASLKTAGKTAALAAGAAAFGGLVAVFKTGVDEQSDFLSGQAQLQAGIKSTGNAAHVSVNGLEKLAGTIQNYSGQTDDSIVASEKLLLTFTKVRNETGKNNDIFNQAVRITADMAARMGGDASKYAVQLGKALNNPVKGLTALTRIGVSFTAQQKHQVAAMIDAGNTMGAQKLIIAELNREFGGSARAAGKTLPGQLQRAKRSFEDISQSLIVGLMPVLTELASVLLQDIMPAFSAVMGFIGRNIKWLTPLALGITAVVAAMRAWAIIQAIINGELLAFPLLTIAVALIAFVALLVMAYKKCTVFRNIVNAVFKGIKVVVRAWWLVMKAQFTAFIAIVRAVYAAFKTAFQAVRVAASSIGRAIVAAVRGMVSAVRSVVHNIVAYIVTPFRNAFSTVGSIAHSWWTRIVDIVRGMISAVSNVAHGIINALSAPFTAAFTAVRNTVSSAISWIRGAINGLTSSFSSIGRAFANVWNAFASFWNGIELKIPGIHAGPIKVGGFTLGLPDLPFFASGAFVTGPTAAIVGEGGNEFVLPERMLRSLLSEYSGTTIVINGALDPDAVARQVESLLRGRARRVRGVQAVGTATL